MVNWIMGVKVPEVPDLTKETERVYKGFRQVGQGIYVAFSGIADMFSKVVRDMVSPSMETLSTYLSGVFEWCEVRRKAQELGLVSDWVLVLTGHRKARVGKKNCNRVRKEVRLYEKRSVPAGHGKRWEQARRKAARDGGGGCARTGEGPGY